MGNKFYQQKPDYRPNYRPDDKPEDHTSQRFVRFVLNSGAAIELSQETLEEVAGSWADRCSNAVCGQKADTARVAIPVANIAYVEEVLC